MEDLVRLRGTDLKRICYWHLVWRGEVTHILTDLESGYVLVSVGLLVPLSEGSTLKNFVILCGGILSDGKLKNMHKNMHLEPKSLWDI